MIVGEDQQSLAIGRKGQNVRLASKLTGWDIDIMTRAELEQSVAEDGAAEDDAEGSEASGTDASTETPEADASEVDALAAEAPRDESQDGDNAGTADSPN